jgi:hypothetical protein
VADVGQEGAVASRQVDSVFVFEFGNLGLGQRWPELEPVLGRAENVRLFRQVLDSRELAGNPRQSLRNGVVPGRRSSSMDIVGRN